MPKPITNNEEHTMLRNLSGSKIAPITRNRKSYFSRKANTTAELQKLVETAVALDMAITIRFHGALSINTNTGKILTAAQYVNLNGKGHIKQSYFDDWKGAQSGYSAFVYSVPTRYPETKVLIRNVHETLNRHLVLKNSTTTDGVWVDPDNTVMEEYPDVWRFTVDFFTANPFSDSDIDTSDWAGSIIPFAK